MIAWQIFVNPVEMGSGHIWLVLPLCGMLAAIYKTIRVRHLRQLPLAILSLWAYLLVGLIVLGVAFYLLLEYVA
ncbi:hypothetical protein LCGC14_1785060 [marine sediment metagenome]|uniref:Uncharacterized protein n=1 Tax=marine sediment metagenome TaxID=412755 RepID=A0A0F9GU85_9ZZZZ